MQREKNSPFHLGWRLLQASSCTSNDVMTLDIDTRTVVGLDVNDKKKTFRYDVKFWCVENFTLIIF